MTIAGAVSIFLLGTVVGTIAGFIGGFRFADYLNERQKLRAYFREREAAYREIDQGRGGDR
jgi:hypothetical protein